MAHPLTFWQRQLRAADHLRAPTKAKIRAMARRGDSTRAIATALRLPEELVKAARHRMGCVAKRGDPRRWHMQREADPYEAIEVEISPCAVTAALRQIDPAEARLLTPERRALWEKLTGRRAA